MKRDVFMSFVKKYCKMQKNVLDKSRFKLKKYRFEKKMLPQRTVGILTEKPRRS